MGDLFWLTGEKIERLRPFFPKSHGKSRVDERRVLSGVVVVNRKWAALTRWGERGVFTQMMQGLAAVGAELTCSPETPPV
jgi:hypothetical protein